ncbi:EamA family transporter RarD [Acidobacteriota bacterium]
MSENRKGTLYAIAAFSVWGVLPIYWKALQHVSSLQILAHRILWSFVFLVFLMTVGKRWNGIKTSLSQPKTKVILLVTTVIITINWLTYIWAVTHGHIIDSSLGYFINPLISVFLGVIFLKERLNVLQIVSFCLALVGVLYLTFQYGRIPWIALTLAFTFGIYGLLRKTVRIDGLSGLTVETAIISPVVLSFLIFVNFRGDGVFGSADLGTHLLLIGAGIATSAPLLWFVNGARRIPLYSIGFYQFIGPTLQFIIGVFLYKEPFTQSRLLGFIFIWGALVLFLISNSRRFKKAKIPVAN